MHTRRVYVAESITSVSFTADSQCLLVSTQDSTLRLMDKPTGGLLNEYGYFIFIINLLLFLLVL